MFEAIAKAKIVVLTGAGASVPLGLYTTRQFLEYFSTKGYQRLTSDPRATEITLELDQIRQATQNGSDIEDVLSLIERRRDAATLLVGDLPFSQQVLLGDPASILAYRDRQTVMADVIYDEVIRHYSTINTTQAAQLYKELLQGFPTWFRRVPELGLTLPFFTMNYDTAVESAASHLSDANEEAYKPVRLAEGWANPPGATERRWSRTEYLNYTELADVANVVLIKLHGSVRWAWRTDVREPYLAEVPLGTGRDPGQLRHAVLYPSLTPKDITDEPFRTSYQCLRACLHKAQLLIVIGTSLRDPEIKAELRDAMEANSALHIVLIDPVADHENVAQLISAPAARIAGLKAEFKSPLNSIMGCLRDFAHLACGVEARAKVRFGKTFDASVCSEPVRTAAQR